MALLEMKGITKLFYGIPANDHIDLSVEESEIHALLGENGAGKTTLMNILYGLYHCDEGEIWWNGVKQDFQKPLDAIACGIGMVHQHVGSTDDCLTKYHSGNESRKLPVYKEKRHCEENQSAVTEIRLGRGCR